MPTVQRWEKHLTLISEIIDEWLSVQRKWLYLEGIFIGGDISAQLPEEAEKFNNIDKEFQEVNKSGTVATSLSTLEPGPTVGVRHEEIDIFPRSLPRSLPRSVLASEYINIFCYFCGPVAVCFLPAQCFRFRSWPTVPQIRLWWMFVWYRDAWTTFSGSERNSMGVKSRSMITWNTSGCSSQGEMIVGFTGKRFFAFAFGLAKMLLDRKVLYTVAVGDFLFPRIFYGSVLVFEFQELGKRFGSWNGCFFFVQMNRRMTLSKDNTLRQRSSNFCQLG